MPLVLLVVGLILAAVLRALVAPAYLIAHRRRLLRGDARPLHLRLLRARQRRDRLQPGPALVPLPGRPRGRLQHLPDDAGARGGGRAAVPARASLVALVNTGGVVTGAGLILAGTFATLTLLPLEELVQIGATVAIGVLLDTFVVRALLIPAITYRLGERTWWPSRSPRPRRASVAGADLHLLALGGVGAALLLQRLAGLVDVVGEAVDLLAAERLLDQRPQHFHVFGVGRHRVGGQHPAALGRELPGDVELVVVLARRPA